MEDRELLVRENEAVVELELGKRKLSVMPPWAERSNALRHVVVTAYPEQPEMVVAV